MSLTRSRHRRPLEGSPNEVPVMTKISPSHFSPELVALMKAALDTAVDQIAHSYRMPATKAKMAERIVRTASEGVTDLRELMSAAVDEGSVPAA